jgi:WipA-like, phosphatase domain
VFNHAHKINIHNYAIFTSSFFPDPDCIADAGSRFYDGDNHGSTFKYLSYLKFRRILTIEDKDFVRLHQILKLPITDITPKLIGEIDGIFSRIQCPETAKNCLLVPLGDFFNERVGFEYATYKLFERLAQLGIKYRFVPGNHDLDLLINYEQKLIHKSAIFYSIHVGKGADSLTHLQYLIDKGILDDQTMMDMIGKYIYEHLSIIEYTRSKDRITYYTHAPFDEDAFKCLTETLHVPYHANTLDEIAATLDAIQQAFKLHVADKTVTSLELDNFVWSRVRNQKKRANNANYVNGHHLPTIAETIYENELLLDNDLGKSKEKISDFGNATALYSHDNENPDNIFVQEVEALRKKIPQKIIELFGGVSIDDLIDFNTIYSRNQINNLSQMLCQTNSIELWKKLLSENMRSKLPHIRNKPHIWGIFCLLQKYDLLNKEAVNKVFSHIVYLHDLYQLLFILDQYNNGTLFTLANIKNILDKSHLCFKIRKVLIERHVCQHILQNDYFISQEMFSEICTYIEQDYSSTSKNNSYCSYILKSSRMATFSVIFPDWSHDANKDEFMKDLLQLDKLEYVFGRIKQIMTIGDDSLLELLAFFPMALTLLEEKLLSPSFQQLEIIQQETFIKNYLTNLLQLYDIQDIFYSYDIDYSFPGYIFTMILHDSTENCLKETLALLIELDNRNMLNQEICLSIFNSGQLDISYLVRLENMLNEEPRVVISPFKFFSKQLPPQAPPAIKNIDNHNENSNLQQAHQVKYQL